MWVAARDPDNKFGRNKLKKVPEKVKFKNIDFYHFGAPSARHVQVNGENLLQLSANLARTSIDFCNRNTHAITFYAISGRILRYTRLTLMMCMTVNWLRPWQLEFMHTKDILIAKNARGEQQQFPKWLEIKFSSYANVKMKKEKLSSKGLEWGSIKRTASINNLHDSVMNDSFRPRNRAFV